jgi:hypothetical protein
VAGYLSLPILAISPDRNGKELIGAMLFKVNARTIPEKVLR